MGPEENNNKYLDGWCSCKNIYSSLSLKIVPLVVTITTAIINGCQGKYACHWCVHRRSNGVVFAYGKRSYIYKERQQWYCWLQQISDIFQNKQLRCIVWHGGKGGIVCVGNRKLIVIGCFRKLIPQSKVVARYRVLCCSQRHFK